MKTLEQYSQLMDQFRQSPGALVELSDEMAAEYARCAEQLVKVKLEKPKKWIEIKKSKMSETDSGWEGKPLSDKLTEMIWRSTKSGKEEVRLKYRMAGLEKCLSSIKSHVFNLNREAENTY